MTDTRAVEKLHGNRLVRPRLLFERNENEVALAPWPNTALVHKSEPKASVFRQREIEQTFVAGKHLKADLREHDAIVGDDGAEQDFVYSGVQKFSGGVTFDFQRKRECGFDQSISKIGGGGLEIPLQQARNALPFGRLQGGGNAGSGQLKPAAGFDWDKTALQIYLRS